MSKDLRIRNLSLVEDDRWKRKGAYHHEKYPEPEICPKCHGECVVEGTHGVDEMCTFCDGEGVIYE